ncbi:MAG: hypothetical protein IJL77_06675 [Clostridia bacterium]|nr:hypothetical protein [Clostridia bacterium]
MKKITAIIMILAVVFAFASCGGKADDNATDPTETQSEVTVQAQAFKAGVWAVVKDGEEIGYYTFTDDMKQCSYETEKSGVPFDYEINGDSYIFHMGSADDVTTAKAVFSGEDDCTITWDDPARTETLKYKGAVEAKESDDTDADTASDTAADTSADNAKPDAAPLVINSEPYTVTAKDGFNNAGVTELKCDATEEYTFKAVSGDATWQIFILDKRFEDGARYLVQAEKPALTGDGELDIKAGQYIYVVCSESNFTSDTASDSALEINYDD